MNISYDKLFEKLKEKEISKTELRKNLKFSTATLAKLSKNEPVSMKVIEDICNFLSCQPGEIMGMEQGIDKSTLLYIMQEEKRMKLKELC